MQNKDENLNELEFWCTLLLCGKNPQFYTKLEKLPAFSEDLTMADDSWKNISQEERDWAYKLSIEGGALDYDVGMRCAERRGRKENALENARNLLRMNLLTLEQISQAVNLPLEEILKLKEELEQTVTE